MTANQETNESQTAKPTQKSGAAWVTVFVLLLMTALGVGGYQFLSLTLERQQESMQHAINQPSNDAAVKQLRAEILDLQQIVRAMEEQQTLKNAIQASVGDGDDENETDENEALSALKADIQAQQLTIEQLQEEISEQAKQQKTGAVAPVTQALMQLRADIFQDKKAKKSLEQLSATLEKLPVATDQLRLRARIADQIGALRILIEKPVSARDMLRDDLKTALDAWQQEIDAGETKAANKNTNNTANHAKNNNQAEDGLRQWFNGHVKIESRDLVERSAHFKTLRQYWKNDGLMGAVKHLETMQNPISQLQQWYQNAQRFYQVNKALKQLTDDVAILAAASQE